MRRSYLLLAAVAIVAIAVVPAMAFGNAGVHGNYTMDDDACAGCHRAHTAPSQLTWTDTVRGTERSALLLSTASTMQEFCYACHDATGQGAETNVEDGIYQSHANLSGGAYGTPDAPLNGGLLGRWDPVDSAWEDVGGNPLTSRHMAAGLPPTGGWQAYGGGVWGTTDTVQATGSVFADTLNWGGPVTDLDCDTCHDVHGTSNYRILKASVRGVTVGGYTGGANTPNAFVYSNEPGFPVSTGGFMLQTDYTVAQADGVYVPNYTTPLYAKPPGEHPWKGMTGWCVGCHTVYNSMSSTYSAADTPLGEWDGIMRYRHPMNVPLSNFHGPNSLVITGTVANPTQNEMPYDHDLGETAVSDSDWLECLTCHKAHGTTVEMTGFANVDNAMNPMPNSGNGGTRPDRGSALLRYPNRGVCERCHNK